MAYTSILAVHRLDRSVEYVMDKDKTSRTGAGSASSLEKAVDDARDREKTECGVFESAIGCTLETAYRDMRANVPFPVSWTVKMKKKQKETQDILSYHTQAAGCSDKARAKASGGRQPIEECGRTGL